MRRDGPCLSERKRKGLLHRQSRAVARFDPTQMPLFMSISSRRAGFVNPAFMPRIFVVRAGGCECNRRPTNPPQPRLLPHPRCLSLAVWRSESQSPTAFILLFKVPVNCTAVDIALCCAPPVVKITGCLCSSRGFRSQPTSKARSRNGRSVSADCWAKPGEQSGM